jgi:hypothetical protein
MTRDEFQELLCSLADGWTHRRYGEVADRFADDIFYSDPQRYTFTNRDSLRRFFEDDEGREQSCTFLTAVFDEVQQLGAAEYTYIGTFRYDGTVWIKLADGKIASWREYQHQSEINGQQPGL